MNRLREWWRVVVGKDDAPVTDEAREAVAGSAQRAEDATRQADDMARTVAPLRDALRHNHFEDAVRATFVRRPV
jgi:hypothetical protein